MEDEKYTIEDIHYMDNNSFTLGDEYVRRFVAVALSYCPKRIVDKVMNNVVIIWETSDDNCGSFIDKKIVKGKNIIHINQICMRRLSGNKGIMVVLHEVAHYILGHRCRPIESNAFLAEEKAAWDLAYQWFPDKKAYKWGLKQMERGAKGGDGTNRGG